MRFKKMLMIGIDESKLDSAYWKKIDTLAEERVNLSKDSTEIKKQIADADCLLTSFGITIDRASLDAAPKLRYIGILATAYGKVDIAHAKAKGIMVCNIPGYSTESVAEF